MKRILAFFAFVVLISIMFAGTVFATQRYYTTYYSSFSFSNTMYLASVDGYPNTSTTYDLRFNHTNTTCSASDARFYAQPQRYGFLGTYSNFGTTWTSPGNTGSTVYGGSQDCDGYTGPYRYKLTAYQNNGYAINSPTNKFWVNYYGYPDPY